MPALTVKNIPDDLYSQLKKAAQAHRRSLNSEILYCVEKTIGTHSRTSQGKEYDHSDICSDEESGSDP